MTADEAVDLALSLIDPSLPAVSNLSNAAAVLGKIDRINWAGFYIADGDVLWLGPFSGDPACTRIPFGKGVCGTAASRRQTVVVDDVLSFPGHIACSSESRSEIVVPVLRDGEVAGLIDIDSPEYSRFSSADAAALERLAEALGKTGMACCR